MIRRNVEARAPIHARHLAAGFGREPANAPGSSKTRHHGQGVRRPVLASLCLYHAPAASLGRVRAPPLGDGRPATVSPQAQSGMERAAIPSLPRPCPVTHPKRCGGVALHIGAACWRARLYGAGLWPGLAGHPVGPVIAPRRRGRVARLGLPGRTLRGPVRSAAPRPFASASAPGGRASSLRSAAGVASRPLDRAAPSPALRGPGFLPGPLPILRSPAAPVLRGCSMLVPDPGSFYRCKYLSLSAFAW